jgi:hypothetical protein
MRNFIGKNNFVWFIGVVEDRNDPIRLGRVRVRCYGWHTDDKAQIPTESLPWATPMQDITSAAISGVGRSPTGIVEGTWVVGFFLDGEQAQEPVIIGTMAGAPSSFGTPNVGFNDPNPRTDDSTKSIYPRYTNESDVNSRARNSEIFSKNVNSTIKEPADPYAAQYPYNHVYESESGHLIEIDDTPLHERIHIKHRSGTFVEVHANGDVVTHHSNGWRSVTGNDKVHITGDLEVYVDGNVSWVVGGNETRTIAGSKTETANVANLTYQSGLQTYVTGDVVADGISLVNHTHGQNDGNDAGGGTDTKPPTK